MKLKNKKTGEIVEWFNNTDGIFPNSLAELNEEWEDYEEPKGINEIDVVLDAIGEYCNEHSYYSGDLEKIKILNTVEEKLKAWKRLRDKGFRFTGIAGISNNIFVSFEADSKYSGGHIMYDEYSNTDNKLKEYNEDLMLLFGGEE